MVLEIPEGVRSIGDGAFRGCSSLTSIVIPEGVTSIGDGAFEGCSNLTSIEIPEGVRSIERCTFEKCSSLTSIVIPEGVTSIGDSAFEGCSSLTSIEIPEGLTSIGDNAFIFCRSLKSIKLPQSLHSIGEYTFYECYRLSNIYIPARVTFIGTEALNFLGSHVHTNKKYITKAKVNANGLIKYICLTCENETNKLIIYAPKTLTLSATSFTYTGKQLKPTVTVKDSKGKIIAKSNYNVSYYNNIKAGTATVKITFKGDYYTGTMSKTFTITKAKNSITGTATYSKTAANKAQSFKLNVKATGGKITYKSNNNNVKVDSLGKVTIEKNFSGQAVITVTAGDSNYKTVTKKVTITVKPAATTISSVKNSTAKNASKGKITVAWSKLSYVTGYEIQYSTSSSFASGNKTVNISGASNVSKVISGRTKNKTYYVRIRTYKTIAGKKVYSAWSAKKSVKIGK